MTTTDFPPRGSLRVALLRGGETEERAISLESGAAVLAALQRLGHQVTTIDPADVDWVGIDWNAFDVAFLALHGRFGEDGTVQGILEEAGLPYTGSDAQSSRLAFRKSASKERFLQCGVSTPPYVLIHESDETARIELQAGRLGYPLVVKPDRQGSSIGVSLVETSNDLADALRRCFDVDTFGILESAVLGSEWTVGLFDELVLPPIQIETGRRFFDYQAKYEDEETKYHFEFSLPESVVAAIVTVARESGRALETSGIARVDIRLDERQRPWVLEVNTIPGFTDHSLIPKAAARQGISFETLCARSIESCLARATRPISRAILNAAEHRSSELRRNAG